MSIPEAEIARRVSVLSDGIRRGGLRLTHQRLEIAREVAGSETHPDVETVYQSVRRRVPTVSLDTIYRTMATLVDLGLLKRVSVPTASTRYDPDTSRHHHFICLGCGLVRDVHDETLDQVGIPGAASRLGTVDSVEVQFRGLCNSCMETADEGGDS
jgi:Fur family transcriptional regulator, peroxide stress response regulator